MTTFFLKLFRRAIINRLRKAYFGDQFINTVLEALKLQKTGLPDFKNPPLPPPRKFDLFPPNEIIKK